MRRRREQGEKVFGVAHGVILENLYDMRNRIVQSKLHGKVPPIEDLLSMAVDPEVFRILKESHGIVNSYGSHWQAIKLVDQNNTPLGQYTIHLPWNANKFVVPRDGLIKIQPHGEPLRKIIEVVHQTSQEFIQVESVIEYLKGLRSPAVVAAYFPSISLLGGIIAQQKTAHQPPMAGDKLAAFRTASHTVVQASFCPAITGYKPCGLQFQGTKGTPIQL